MSETLDAGRSRSRSASLDALRGLAALLVVCYHANFIVAAAGSVSPLVMATRSALSSGVTLFFVLSGYLIGGPYVRALMRGTGLPDLSTYAVRRAARILPAYWAVLAFLVVTAAVSGSPAPSLEELGLHATLLHTVVPGQTFTVLDVAWTLGVEAAFYVLVPLAAWMVWRRGRGPVSARVLVAGIVAVATVSAGLLVLAGTGSSPRTQLVSFGVPGSLCLFCPGLLVAVVEEVRKERRAAPLSPRGAGLLGVATVALLLGSVAATGGSARLGRVDAVLAAPGFGLLLALVVSGAAVPRAAARLLAPVGTVSYGLYLWHTVVMRALGGSGHALERLLPADLAWAGTCCLALACSIPVAAASYLIVERPVQLAASRRLQARRAMPVPASRREPAVDSSAAHRAVHRPSAPSVAGPGPAAVPGRALATATTGAWAPVPPPTATPLPLPPPPAPRVPAVVPSQAFARASAQVAAAICGASAGTDPNPA